MILTGRGPEQQSRGVDNALAFINLALALGQVGRPAGGYGCITGQGNGQGGREHGQKADQLPGYRRIDDPDARRHVAASGASRKKTCPGPGKSAYEMLSSMGADGGVRALFVFGSNVAVSAPDARRIQERLQRARLPGGVGLLPLRDRGPGRRRPAVGAMGGRRRHDDEPRGARDPAIARVRPPPGVRTDLEAIVAIADGARPRRLVPVEPRPRRLRRAAPRHAGGTADYHGITYERIRSSDGIFWPCPDATHPGTPRLFVEQFPTPSGRARFHAVDHHGPAEVPDGGLPADPHDRPVLAHYQSGTQTRRIPELQALAPEPFAKSIRRRPTQLGVPTAARSSLTTRRGSTQLPVRLSPVHPEDTVFVPFHWGGERSVNLLTNPALDPISRMPEFKACAVKAQPALARIDHPRRRARGLGRASATATASPGRASSKRC